MKVWSTMPRKNLHIWSNWSAVPRLRILFDRWGYGNEGVRRYLINRFGWAKGANARDLQYQISSHKNRSKEVHQIWKVYILMRERRIDQNFEYVEYSVPVKDPGESPRSMVWAARRRVTRAVAAGNCFSVEDFILTHWDEPPEGYCLKWRWGKNGVHQAYCPPIGESLREREIGMSVAA